MKKSEIIDVELTYLGESLRAWKVLDRQNGKNVVVWLPKAVVERDGSIFTMPRTFAAEKGLI
jgi:hypothetical protein